MGTPYKVYYIQPSLASSNMLVGREEELYTHLRGAFSVARFDNLGNARDYKSWNEHQDWLHVFLCYMRELKNKLPILESLAYQGAPCVK